MLVDLVVWLPNYVVGPLFIRTNSRAPAALIDFFGMYTVIMLIAVSSTYFFSEYTALRTYYPYLWTDTRQMRRIATGELGGVQRRIWPFQLLAAIVPISAAVAIVMLGPEDFAKSGYFTFRALAITLIVVGFVGLLATGLVRASVERTVRLFTSKTA